MIRRFHDNIYQGHIENVKHLAFETIGLTSYVGGFVSKFFRQLALQSQEILLIMAIMYIFGSRGRCWTS